MSKTPVAKFSDVPGGVFAKFVLITQRPETTNKRSLRFPPSILDQTQSVSSRESLGMIDTQNLTLGESL
jgi:hypothetical protein